MWGLSYWALPLTASMVWLAMLLAMLLWWITKGKPHLPSMVPNQHVAYISDIGAEDLKPLFIAMSTITVVIFDVGFIAERWLRHSGRLARNTSTTQKTLSALAIVFAIAGAAGLILLSIFDTLHHHKLHDAFLGVFIGGYVLSAIFICVEYQRLGVHFRQYRILRASFWIKLVFILVEVALAIAFGITQKLTRYNISAVLEWVISLVFTFYVLSFFVDFIPAVRTKHHQSRTTIEEKASADANTQHPMTDNRYADRYNHGGDLYANNSTAGQQYDQPPYSNGYANGHTGS